MPFPRPLPQPTPAIQVVPIATDTEKDVMWQNSSAAQFYNGLPVDAGLSIVVMAVVASDVQDPTTAVALAQLINDSGLVGIDAVYALAVPVVPAEAIDGYDCRLCIQGQVRFEQSE